MRTTPLWLASTFSWLSPSAQPQIVGSINKVTAEQNKAKREEFWANVEVGKTYTGVVKSLTSYGAFVDIGGWTVCATSAS